MWSGRDVIDEVAGGEWVGAGIGGFTTSRERHGTVGSVLPPVFEAYARVLHRAGRRGGSGGGRSVRWAEVAERNGRVMHPLVQWASLQRSAVGSEPGLWDVGPALGRPDPISVRALVSVLSGQASTQSCWFAVWEGNTALDEIRGAGARLRVGGYDCFVVRGDVSRADAELCGVTPSWWWPEDRSWCVASDIDLEATYVGGSRACVDAVVAHLDLEAFYVDAADPVTADGDTVNPPPPTGGAF